MFAPEQLPVKTKLIEEFGLVSLSHGLSDEKMYIWRILACFSRSWLPAIQAMIPSLRGSA